MALLEQLHRPFERIRRNKFDLSAWNEVIDEIKGVPISDEVRSVYEELLVTFPTAASHWTRYAELEMEAGNTAAVRSIFGRCLLECPDVELWFMYLRFIKKNNEGREAEGPGEVKNAYEFTLEHIGNDMHAGLLWQEYIGFLQNCRPGTATYTALYGAGMDESQRTTTLRRAYQRAISVPTQSLDLLWRNYETFETGLGNKQLARKMLEEQRPRFNTARETLTRRRAALEGMEGQLLAVPPGSGGPDYDAQAQLWREYLDFELSNPQRLEVAPLAARIKLAYDQCLVHLRYYPEIWHEYVRWSIDSSGGAIQPGIEVLERAEKALPNCLMLHFAHAELFEQSGQLAQAKEVYEQLAVRLEQQDAEEGAPATDEYTRLTPELGSLLWCQYMRFLRRAETVMEARKLFIRAKKWTKVTWHVYAAAALAEWTLQRDANVARKIFERGFSDQPGYISEVDYVLAYADFLNSVSDLENLQALYERALQQEAGKRSAKLWERYQALLTELGNVAAAAAVERRAAECLGAAPGYRLRQDITKYAYLGVDPCSAQQKQHLDRVLGIAAPPAAAPGRPPPPPGASLEAWGGMPAGPDPELLKSLPPPVAHLLASLPPAMALQGAVPDADLIINLLLAVNLHPDTIATALAAAEQGIVHPIPGALIHQPGTILSAPPPTLPPSAAAAGVKPELGVKHEYGEEGKAGPMVGMKRRGSEGDGFEGDGAAMGIAAGAQDVYRIRAQKRMMHGDV